MKNSTGRCGAGTCGRWARTPNAARAQAQLSTSAATTSSSSSRRSPSSRRIAAPSPSAPTARPSDAGRAASQDAVPGRGSREGDAAERDQAARELLHRDDDREAEPAQAEEQRADRRGLPGAHRITHPWTPLRDPAAPRPGLARWLEDAERVDVALYAAIAQTPTPALDRAMARLSRAADYSRLSLASAAVLAATGGRRGRRAATIGLASVGVAASVVNLGLKPLGRRRRPDRAVERVPVARHVRMPSSTSFPSGHSAAAFAFATGVGHVLPPAAIPLRALAALVAYSRVHTGVHYPGDVVAGALIGTALAQLTTHALDRRTTHRR